MQSEAQVPVIPANPFPIREGALTLEARELTLRARERFDAGDYSAALSEFTRAYDLLESDPRRAALLNNIAVCHERLFRYDLALHYYERYLREAETDAGDRVEVQAVIRGLHDLLGKLHITSNVRAEIWVDEHALGFAPGTVELPAGAHVVKLSASGRQSVQRELNVVARSTGSAHFELEPLPTYHGIAPSYFWAGVGLTAAALVVAGGLSLGALAKHRENQAAVRDKTILPEDEREKRHLTIAADVSYGVAALFAVSSTVLFFLSDFRGPPRDQKPKLASRARIQIAPSFSPRAVQLTFARAWP